MPEKKLSDLKVGDEVLYSSGTFNGFEEITTITKITPTGRIRIARNPEIQFNKYGSEMGKFDSWSCRARIEPLTEEKREEIRRKKIVQKARRALDALSDSFRTAKNLSEQYEKAMMVLNAFGIDVEDD